MTYKIEYDQVDAAARILYAKRAAADKFAYPIIQNDEGSLEVSLPGHLCPSNSTTVAISASTTFTGTWEDTIDYATIIVGVIADQASATDGLAIEWSADGVTKTQDDVFTISANNGKVFTFCPANQYFRVRYTNGGTNQGSFNLQTIMKKTDIKGSSHRINDSIVAQDDAELVKAVLTAAYNGSFVNIAATTSGNLKVANVEDGLSIAKGEVSGSTFIHKFGAAPDFDIGDGFVTVWDAAKDSVTWQQMTISYSTSAIINSISSTDAGDTQDIEIQGLDSNYDLLVQTATLDGQNAVTFGTNLIRVFRMKNVGTTSNAGHIFCFEEGAVAAGVPTASTIRAVMQPGNNQTLMAAYTIPNGKTGYMRDWYASTAGAKQDSQHSIRLLARPQGQVFQLKHLSNIAVTGTSYIQHSYTEPEVFAAKTDIEIRMDTDTDVAGVSAGFDIVLVDN